MIRPPRALALAAALASTAIATQADAQIAPRGRVAHDSAREQRLLQQVTIPENFSATLFAGPPVAMYPACVTTAANGDLYVCVDPNLSLSAEEGRGKVVRLVDVDHDGQADEYTVFAEMDSPRGAIVDGNTVYVMAPPRLTAYRDTDGDGIADESEVLVEGLGFGLDFRGADHTTNGIALGIDGWIYVAVGDYGILEATGKDGTKIARRGGSVVRVRPDGTGLEIHTVGTRNIYDVALDPFMHVFSRDNTNDGDGWNTRLHYLPALADMGYPTRYRNFPDEHFPTLADYGGGSGVGGLWIQDPAYPDGANDNLYTADWTVNKVFLHQLKPKGASFEVEQADFVGIPRPSDLILDNRSNLYVSSLSGGSFTYVGDTVGYVVQIRHKGKPADTAPEFSALTVPQLVELLADFNSNHRLFAQREILRRGNVGGAARQVERLALDRSKPAYARVAALYTLKQLVGDRSHGVLRKAAADPAVKASVLRALADNRSQLRGVPVDLFVKALADADPFVQMQAINGLVRLGAVKQAAALIPFTASDDPALAHVAANALARLGARDALLKAVDEGTPELRAGALKGLRQMHDVATASALVERAAGASDRVAKKEILSALARLANVEEPWAGPWDGGWWGTKPDYTGPYFSPVAWEGTAVIGPALRAALVAASGAEYAGLVEDFARNRVLPLGAGALLAAADRQGGDVRARTIDALVGGATLRASALPLLNELDRAGGDLHVGVARLVAGERVIDPGLLPLLRTAALDASLDPSIRAELLGAVLRLPPETGLELSIEAFSSVNPAAASEAPDPVEAAWRRFVGDRARTSQIDRFIALAGSGTPAERTLAFAVLAQSIRSARTPPALRAQVEPVLEAAWGDETAGPSLVQAIRVMRLESQYTAQMQGVAP